MNQVVLIAPVHATALIAASGLTTSCRYLEFFTAHIRNPHTRRARTLATTESFRRLAAKDAAHLVESRNQCIPQPRSHATRRAIA